MTGEESRVFGVSMVRKALFFLRVLLVPILLIAAMVRFAPWPRAVSLLIAAVILACTFLIVPMRSLGARIRIDADGIACLYRDGRIQSMGWEEITHFNRPGLYFRIMDKRRGPMLHAYAWPLLIERQKELLDVLRHRAPQAIEVSSVGWWKLVFDHLRAFLARS